MIDELTLFALMIVILAFAIIGIAMQNENTHKVIFKEAGINSEITYSLTGGLTTPDKNIEVPNWVIAQQMNAESIAYQIVMPTISIILTLIVCALYIGWKIESTKH